MAEHDEIFSEGIAHHHKIEGCIHIATPPTITSMFIGTMLCEFQLKHPRVDVELVLTERSVNPLEESFDIALGAMPISYPNVTDIPLCRYDLVTVCAPSYLRGRHGPKHPTDLVDHLCLTTALFRTSWGFTHSRGSMSIEVHSHLHCSDGQMVREAARMGMGVAILPAFLANDDLRTGRLVRVLDEFAVAVYWLKAQVPRMKAGRPAVRMLIDFLKEGLQSPPWER